MQLVNEVNHLLVDPLSLFQKNLTIEALLLLLSGAHPDANEPYFGFLILVLFLFFHFNLY